MSIWVRTRDGARATYMLCARVCASPVWSELPSSYVSYLVVSAGTDLAVAILAGAGSGRSHYGGSRFRFRVEPDYYILIF